MIGAQYWINEEGKQINSLEMWKERHDRVLSRDSKVSRIEYTVRIEMNLWKPFGHPHYNTRRSTITREQKALRGQKLDETEKELSKIREN